MQNTMLQHLYATLFIQRNGFLPDFKIFSHYGKWLKYIKNVVLLNASYVFSAQVKALHTKE